jgi:hypothetical protein
VFDVCCDAIVATARHARGDKGPAGDSQVGPSLLKWFDGLPPIFGRDGKSPPGQRRLRERLQRRIANN